MSQPKSKYKGLDSREIKCSCHNENCDESGISFEENMLKFHFLEYIGTPKILHQTTKIMMLDKKNVIDLILKLSEVAKNIK